jgi:predicted transcriptional regulator
MSTVELKLSLHQLIDGVSDNSVLEAVYTLLSKATANQEEDWYNLLSEAEKASIERGLDDLKNGRVVSNEVAMKRISEKVSRLKNG